MDKFGRKDIDETIIKWVEDYVRKEMEVKNSTMNFVMSGSTGPEEGVFFSVILMCADMIESYSKEKLNGKN